jgi:hypothetical protein
MNTAAIDTRPRPLVRAAWTRVPLVLPTYQRVIMMAHVVFPLQTSPHARVRSSYAASAKSTGAVLARQCCSRPPTLKIVSERQQVLDRLNKAIKNGGTDLPVTRCHRARRR